MWYEFMIVASTITAALLLKWFIEPYSIYKRRCTVKEFDIVENGKALPRQSHSSPPFLLADAGQTEFDLTLVVPAYNEEERLPSMLKEHIEFLQKFMKNSAGELQTDGV